MLSWFQWANSFVGTFGETNQSELAAFTSYALAFPNSFLALIDTYDVSKLMLVIFSIYSDNLAIYLLVIVIGHMLYSQIISNCYLYVLWSALIKLHI